MIAPDKDYRPNPLRAIYVTGIVDETLVARIVPTLLSLQAASRDPITVYIDSPGGDTRTLTTLLALLRLEDQDMSPPCTVITVATGRVASAAADLLCSGDYAIAFENSTVIYHGNRLRLNRHVTLEDTSRLSDHIRDQNAQFAIDLAERIESRFLFQFTYLRERFAHYRAQQGNRTLSDLDCFIELVGNELSGDACDFWERAKKRRGRYEELSTFVTGKVQRYVGKATTAELECRTVKAIADFELRRNKSNVDWTFKKGGLNRLVEDFFLFDEVLTSYRQNRLASWSKRFAKTLLSKVDADRIGAIQDVAEREKATFDAVWISIQPIVAFFLAVCYALQEGENFFTARDAYWLGLIDEVIGTDLFCRRHLAEYQPVVKARATRTTTKKR